MKPGPREGFRWTRETISYAFELWHRKYLCTPTLSEWRRAGPDHPSSTTVKGVYGSWNAAVEAAGFRPRLRGHARRKPPIHLEALPTPSWSRDAIVRAFHHWFEKHGRVPRIRDWRLASDTHPNASTVKRLFGSWNAALATAGFQPTLSSRRYDSSSTDQGRA